MCNSEEDNRREAVRQSFGAMELKSTRVRKFKPRNNAAIKAYEDLQEAKALKAEWSDELYH